MSLPSIRPPQPADPFHTRRLSEWLREWDLDRQLRSGSRPDKPPAKAKPIRGARRPLEIGQVRLLRPTRALARERPRYVEVLSLDAKRGRCRIAPFSRFRVPAVPGELETEFPAMALRILCLWNTRETFSSALEPSGFIEKVSALDLTRVGGLLSFLDEYRPLSALPDEWVRRLGPPLHHPADPRHLYLAEEGDAFSAALPPRSGASPAYRHPSSSSQSFPLAADSSDPYPDDENL